MNANTSDIGTTKGFCYNTAEFWQLIGVVLLIFKIVIPIILIILGMFDLGKAVISSDEKAIQKSAKTLAYRIVAAVIIFFIPSLISFVFNVINAFSDASDDYEVCKACIVSPNKEGNAEDRAKNKFTCRDYIYGYEPKAEE